MKKYHVEFLDGEGKNRKWEESTWFRTREEAEEYINDIKNGVDAEDQDEADFWASGQYRIVESDDRMTT